MEGPQRQRGMNGPLSSGGFVSTEFLGVISQRQRPDGGHGTDFPPERGAQLCP